MEHFTGMAMGNEISKMYDNHSSNPRKLGHFFIAIDIDQVYNAKREICKIFN